jgi:hypothetical protein
MGQTLRRICAGGSTGGSNLRAWAPMPKNERGAVAAGVLTGHEGGGGQSRGGGHHDMRGCKGYAAAVSSTPKGGDGITKADVTVNQGQSKSKPHPPTAMGACSSTVAAVDENADIYQAESNPIDRARFMKAPLAISIKKVSKPKSINAGDTIEAERIILLDDNLETVVVNVKDTTDLESSLRHRSTFVLLNKLGAGKFASCFRARRKSDGRIFAIKFVFCKSKVDADFAIKEGQLLLTLRHPNIVEVESIFILHSYICLVLEFCDSGDLQGASIDRPATITPDRIVAWLRQLLSALAYLQKNLIIHRDLKLANSTPPPRAQPPFSLHHKLP